MSDRAYCIRVTRPEQFRWLMGYVEKMNAVVDYNGTVRLTRHNLIQKGSLLVLLTADRADLWDSLITEGGMKAGKSQRPEEICESDIYRLEQFRWESTGRSRAKNIEFAEQIAAESEAQEHLELVEKAISESAQSRAS